MVDGKGWVAVDGVWSPTNYRRSVDPATGFAMVSLPVPRGVVVEPGQAWALRLAGGRVVALMVRRAAGGWAELIRLSGDAGPLQDADPGLGGGEAL